MYSLLILLLLLLFLFLQYSLRGIWYGKLFPGVQGQRGCCHGTGERWPQWPQESGGYPWRTFLINEMMGMERNFNKRSAAQLHNIAAQRNSTTPALLQDGIFFISFHFLTEIMYSATRGLNLPCLVHVVGSHPICIVTGGRCNLWDKDRLVEVLTILFHAI